VREGQQQVYIIIHEPNELEPYNETIIELRPQATTQILPRPLLTNTYYFRKISVFWAQHPKANVMTIVVHNTRRCKEFP
jgi:hypothetical protein